MVKKIDSIFRFLFVFFSLQTFAIIITTFVVWYVEVGYFFGSFQALSDRFIEQYVTGLSFSLFTSAAATLCFLTVVFSHYISKGAEVDTQSPPGEP